MTATVYVLIIATALCALIFAFAEGAHTVVSLANGRAKLLKGHPPGRLVSDLDDVARLSPRLRGEVRLSGAGGSLRVGFAGLPDWCRQRVRNVVG